MVMIVGIQMLVKFDEGRSLVRYREVNGNPGIYIHGNLHASRWVTIKPNLILIEN